MRRTNSLMACRRFISALLVLLLYNCCGCMHGDNGADRLNVRVGLICPVSWILLLVFFFISLLYPLSMGTFRLPHYCGIYAWRWQTSEESERTRASFTSRNPRRIPRLPPHTQSCLSVLMAGEGIQHTKNPFGLFS